MAKPIYHFDPKTMTYFRIDNKIQYRISNIISHLVSSVFAGLACFVLFVMLFESPNEKVLRSEKLELEAQYELLNSQIEEIQEVLTDIQQRDDNLYRVVVNADPVPSEAREIDKTSVKYKDLREKTSSDIATLTTQKVDELRRKLYVQSKSFN